MPGGGFSELLRIQQGLGPGDLLLVSKHDDYISGTVRPEDNDILRLSGFAGTSGRMTIAREEIVLWVDGRYEGLARRQFEGTPVQLRSHGGETRFQEYVCRLLAPPGDLHIRKDTVLFDPSKWSDKEIGDLRRLCPRPAWRPVRLAGAAAVRRGPRRITLATAEETGADARRRLELLRGEMGPSQVHLLSNPEDVAWLTGLRADDFPCSRGLRGRALVSRERAVLYADLDAAAAAAAGRALPGWDLVLQEGRLFGDLRRTMAEREDLVLYVERHERPGALSSEAMERVREACQAYRIVEQDRSLAERGRIRKTGPEIGAIRDAGRRLSRVMAGAISFLQEELGAGRVLTEGTLRRRAEEIAAGLGAGRPAFPSMVSSGRNSSLPHHLAEEGKRIRPGEIVVLDLGFYFGSATVASDMARTVLAGAAAVPTRLQRRIYSRVLDAFLRQLLVRFRPGGLKARQLDQLGRSVLSRAAAEGFRFPHSTGHGLGINAHELAITISPGSDITLQEGFCYTIEPGLYGAAAGEGGEVFGVRLEDTVVVRRSGEFLSHESMQDFPCDLRLIDPTLLDAANRAHLGLDDRERRRA